ncbi:hypothetical protein UMZ34_16510 [Halopseudomonas pachastrellae]|nr:hypothetical protein UMZ34_16510 [Halopseudomonas pachastrellae]
MQPLIRLADHDSAAAADKVRIAELEAERDEWHRLFDSAGQLSKNACDDLNSAKSRIAELEAALRNIAAEVDGNIRECVRDCVNQRGNVQDIYEYCDRIDSTVGAALAQQGKEGE